MRKSAARPVSQELRSIAIFIAIVWAVYGLSLWLPLANYGLRPRSVSGLVGIVTMPFLHASFGHLLSNTIPLFVLLCLLAGSRAHFWEIVGLIVILGGIFLWVVGRDSIHVGASGLIFGLMAFLVFSGFLEGRPKSLLISVVTVLLYGGSLITGILPTVPSQVSWEGHLCGALAGGIVAYQLVKLQRSEEKGEP